MGRGGDRGWRRRNEFSNSNRNRYTNNNTNGTSSTSNNARQENIGPSSYGKENKQSPKSTERQHNYYQQNAKYESDSKRLAPQHSSSSAEASGGSRHHPQNNHGNKSGNGGPPRGMPPFTPNTEYTGSASLTAKRQGGAGYSHVETESWSTEDPHHHGTNLKRSPELQNINDQNLDMRIDTTKDLRESLNRRAHNRKYFSLAINIEFAKPKSISYY